MTQSPRDLLAQGQWTQEAAANLLGVDIRTMKRWLAPPTASSARAMPEPARRLLAVALSVPGVEGWLRGLGG